MFPVYSAYSMGNIPSGSELLFHLFPVFRSVCKLIQQGWHGLREVLTDGGLTNQPVILQGYVGLSHCQVPWCYFNPTSKGFLKLGIDFLMEWCMHFCSGQKGRWHIAEILVSWDIRQKVAVASFSLVGKVSRALPRGLVTFAFFWWWLVLWCWLYGKCWF